MVIPPVATTASPSPTSSYVGTEALFWAPNPLGGCGAVIGTTLTPPSWAPAASIAADEPSERSQRPLAASHPSWGRDAASGRWLRSEGSSAAMDAAGAQLGAVNVVSITAPHPPSGFGAQNNASVPTYELVGEGDAVVATGGMTIAGRWRKAASDAPMLLFGADGQPLALAPGNTWVELVPAGQGSLTIG